jgi:hypothetical protein
MPNGHLTPRLLWTSAEGMQDNDMLDTSSDFMNMLDDPTANDGLFSDFDTNHSSLQCDLSHSMSDKHEGHESDRQDKSPFTSGLAVEIAQSTAGASNTSSLSSSDEPGQLHCELAVLHMLMELGTPSPCRGRSRSSRDLGAILKTSRKSLACASKVLECNTCPTSTNAALLVTTLLLHTLSWYDLILQEQDASISDNSATGGDYGGMVVDENSPERGSSESDILHERGPSFSSDATGIVVPPMLIGSYELDAESQGRMVCHVILSDLKKIDGLAKSVCAKLRDAETAPSSPEASQAPELICAVLRQRHCQLLRVIKKKLEIPSV